MNRKQLTANIRNRGQAAITELLAFARERQLGNLVAQIEGIPVRDGKLDLEAAGLSIEDIVREARARKFTPEKIIDDFILAQSQKLGLT